MKIRSFILAAAALVAGFSSCSKDDNNNVLDGEKDIYIKFAQPSGARADVTQLDGGEVSTISSGHLYFTKDDGTVMRYYIVDNSGLVGTLRPSVLAAGTIIESLSATATQVYFYANMFEGQDKNIANISAIDDEVVYLAEQRAADFGVANAIMKGSGPIRNVTSDPLKPYDYEAIVEVAPMISRIEIVELKSDATDGPSKASLMGIYVNNYHPDLTLGNATVSPRINNGQDYWTYFRDDLPNGAYAAADFGYLFDDDYDAAATPKLNSLGARTSKGGTIKPKTTPNGAWAYNVFPVGEPHVVFHFNDVADNNNLPFENETIKNHPTYGPSYSDLWDEDTAYLTLTRFVEQGTDNTLTLKAGHIYRIHSLSFKVSDMGETPEPELKKDVYVEVKVMPWKVVNADGKFD